jgi:hypothetical protein
MEEMEKRREALYGAYSRVFCGGFTEPTADGRTVLEDLKKFCGFELSDLAVSRKGSVDVNATMARLGQKEMFLRIVHLAGLVMQPSVPTGEKNGNPAVKRSRKRTTTAAASATLDRDPDADARDAESPGIDRA